MEVCVDSVASAINAQDGGARARLRRANLQYACSHVNSMANKAMPDSIPRYRYCSLPIGAIRIELCANLIEGGTTPSPGLLANVKRKVSIPVFVMVRPRGGDFCYNDMEMAVMKDDINFLKQQGADGFVFGILKRNGSIDEKKCKELLAIDMSKDIMASLSVIVDLGFARVLSSGGCFNALDGISMLTNMIKEHGQKIIVMPGGGINAGNLEMLLECGATEFHGSASETIPSPMSFKHPFLFLGSKKDNEYFVKETSLEKVSGLVKISNAFRNKSLI